MALLDQQSQETMAQVSSAVGKVTPVALGGQYIFGYTINEFAALVGIVVTVVQFSYWVYEKYTAYKEKKNGCKV